MIQSGNWLYLRIYTGFNTADHYLLSLLFPVANAMIAGGLADRWFFIRYADPDFHLRYRIRIRDRIKAQTYQEQLNNSLEAGKQSMLIWKYESGNYMPEKERYGLNAMEYAECIFYYDSEACMEFLNSGIETRDENMRWLFALALANVLLNDFGFTLSEKKNLLLHLNRSFGQEFGKDKHLAKQLSERYRKHRLMIKSILEADEINEDFKYVAEILTRRSAATSEAIQGIGELYKNGRMEVAQEDLLASLVHMSMNRIFKNNNRLHEMVLYDLLFRYYKESFMKNTNT